MEFFSPEQPPATRVSSDPERNKNNDFLAQARLMGRNPEGDLDWSNRYAKNFRELYKTDDSFRNLVNSNLDDEVLTQIQERLDRKGNR